MTVGKDRVSRPPALLPVYPQLLERARRIADQSLERMQHLASHFPSDLPEVVLAQMEDLHAAPRRDRRCWIRVPGIGEGAQLRHPGVGTGPQGQVNDRSPGGLALVVTRPYRVGDVVFLHLPEASPAAGVPAVVRHCEPCGSGWVVGCQRLDPGEG